MVTNADTGPNAESARYWNEEGGRSWVDEHARFDGQLAPFADAVLALAAPQPGERALDVGCGTGALTVRVAEAVAPDGGVVGLDVSEPMAALARTRAAEAGVPVEVVVADAQTGAVAAHGPFDLLVSRFGVMFFDDPVAAFTNLAGALSPGGRVAFACWQGYERNPWMSVPMDAALEHLPPEPVLPPGAPGPFAFGDREHVQAVLERAGLADVRVEAFEGELLLAGGGSVEDAYAFLENTSLGRRLLQQDDPEVGDRVERSVRGALQAHARSDGVTLGFATWLVSARR